jgi:N-acetylmuramoyl-L-alanine amidase
MIALTVEATAGVRETDILALTAWAEASGDTTQGGSSVEERIAVLSVIRNRVADPAWWGDTYRAVCLKAFQFSCWNDDAHDANHLRLIALTLQVQANQTPDNPIFIETQFLADGIRRGLVLDRVHGADYYYAPQAMTPPGSAPAWAKSHGVVIPPLAIVGRQHFYKLGPDGVL